MRPASRIRSLSLPILLYRLLWVMVGLRSYLPYRIILLVLHLVAAGILLALMRRSGVRPWIATIVAVAFVYFGSGGENKSDHPRMLLPRLRIDTG